MRNVCSQETLETYRRFRVLKGPRGNMMRECPNCTKLIECKDWTATVKCPGCKHTFCKHHGDAHQGKSCVMFCWEIRRNMALAADDRQFVAETTRPCPRCKAPTYRSSGCNHMTCREWCTPPPSEPPK